MDQANINHIDEREYYRLDDEVEFAYCILPGSQHGDDEATQQQLFNDASFAHFELIKALDEIDTAAHESFLEINRQNTALADYLNFIDEKIRLVAHACFQAEKRPLAEINISAGGCAFFTNEAIEPGARLKIKLVIRPSYYGILCNAVVVANRYLPKRNADNPHCISVKFADLTEHDRQRIQRHIMRQQARNLSTKT